jgi:hypothetical protein
MESGECEPIAAASMGAGAGVASGEQPYRLQRDEENLRLNLLHFFSSAPGRNPDEEAIHQDLFAGPTRCGRAWAWAWPVYLFTEIWPISIPWIFRDEHPRNATLVAHVAVSFSTPLCVWMTENSCGSGAIPMATQ